jgi:hypothetical protein
MTNLRECAAWQALTRHYAQVHGTHLRTLFATDAKRGERFTAQGAGLYLDYSKNRITLAQRIIPELESKAAPVLSHDSSTNAQIRRYRDLKETV